MPRSEVLCCMGTRPEIIKLAPVVHALRQAGLPAHIVNSGQHQTSVTQPLYAFFGLTPEYDLALPRNGGGLGELNAALLDLYVRLFEQHQPGAVVVQGDTSSAWQAAQAASMLHIPVAHVEAGLRTYDLNRPFPEELNRTLIGRVSHWHFAPTPAAAAALQREAVPGLVEIVGNTVVDAALEGWHRVSADPAPPADLPPAVAPIVKRGNTLLVTAHRRENWGAGITGIASAVLELLEGDDSLDCVWVLHPNPVVAQGVQQVLGAFAERYPQRLQLVPPQNYGEMLWMMGHAWLLLTDSGGIQEEAVTLGLPALVTREETERPEVIECGAALLVGCDRARIVASVRQLRDSPEAYARMRTPHQNPFGAGDSSRRIAEQLAKGLATIETPNAAVALAS